MPLSKQELDQLLSALAQRATNPTAAPRGQELGPRQATFRSVAVGDNQGGGIAAMQEGFLIRGVVIDNPSGSWVVLKPTLQYIPPYTFGWSTNIVPGQQVMGAAYIDGPVGNQPSSKAGLPVVIYLYDIQVGNQAGYTFVDTNPDTLLLNGVVTATLAGSQPTLLTPPSGKRIRLLSANIGYTIVTAPVNPECPAKMSLRWLSNTGVIVIQLAVGPDQLTDDIPFEYDFPVDESISANFQSLWANVGIIYSVRYQIV